MNFSFLRQLSQPFPQRNSGRKALLDTAATALFVAVFLYILQPFDMTRSGIPPLWHSLAYGFVTFTVNVGYDAFCERVLRLKTDVESWTLWKWIVRVTGLIICIAIANFFYFNYSHNWSYFYPGALGRMILNTFFVGLFPTIAFGLIVQLRAAQANVHSAAEIEASPVSNSAQAEASLINSEASNVLIGDPRSDGLEINSHNIRYVEAMQNYVSVCHISNGKLSRHLIRQTLSATLEQCQSSGVIRCHRSFLVNTECIRSVQGNAQGLKLTLNDISDTEIPVSRPYITDLKQILE
ncbi:MAG: LytTR family DNA-binding domain-containing protein [Pseudomonadota bacterium]